jgi:threonine dehydrogenase-like Zn-dependent dehydrogenase
MPIVRATTIHGPADIRVEDVPDPAIENRTDAIVKVAAGCICGTDLWAYRGDNPVRRGQTIGHECIGEIVAVGDAVRDFTPGDFVIVPFDHCDNTCAHCLVGANSACIHLGITQSGQAEFTRVTQADGTLARTDGTPEPGRYPALLALTDVMATGWHAATASKVAPGSTVVVVGDGAVGLCGVLAASTMGAGRIIIMSRHPDRQQLARTFGATDIVAERGPEGEAMVLDLTHGTGGDAVLECVGSQASVSTAFAVARPGSTVGCVGAPHGVALPVNRMFKNNIGFAGGMAPVRRYLPHLLTLVTSGRIDPGPVFDLTLPLDSAAEGYRAMNERRATKVQLLIS